MKHHNKAESPYSEALKEMFEQIQSARAYREMERSAEDFLNDTDSRRNEIKK